MSTEKTAEQINQERADAFELGIHLVMKQANMTDPQAQQEFLQVCRETARNLSTQESK